MQHWTQRHGVASRIHRVFTYCEQRGDALDARHFARVDSLLTETRKDDYMKRIVVRISGMPFDPTYEIDDDTVAIGDRVRVPGSGSSFIEEGEIGSVIALESLYTGPCKRVTRA